jgi:methyl-accepting chemotaxis protein
MKNERLDMKKKFTRHVKTSLLSKIAIPTIILVAFVTSTLSITAYICARNMLLRQINKEMSSRAQSLTFNIEGWLTDIAADIRLMSQYQSLANVFLSSSIGKAARKLANEHLVKMVDIYPIFQNISLAGDDGGFIASSIEEAVGKVNVSDRKYFQSSMNGEAAISDLLVSKSKGI